MVTQTVRNQYAHPLWHAAKRRNCDGDEDAIMLALDPLLNFSKTYLPQQSGTYGCTIIHNSHNESRRS